MRMWMCGEGSLTVFVGRVWKLLVFFRAFIWYSRYLFLSGMLMERFLWFFFLRSLCWLSGVRVSRES